MRLTTPAFNQLPLANSQPERRQADPIPDCCRCGKPERGHFGIFDDHFCRDCWLLHPTTQKYQLQQIRDAMKEDQC